VMIVISTMSKNLFVYCLACKTSDDILTRDVRDMTVLSIFYNNVRDECNGRDESDAVMTTQRYSS
jgi:hypothetical protein